jgi:hypothetical protein
MAKPLRVGLSFGALFVIACGASKPPPPPPPAAEPAAMPPDAAAAPHAEPAPQATTSASASAPAPAPASEANAPPPQGGVVIGETKDECTPVGVDFEKRARPKLKECYAAGKKKQPNLEGTVKIKVTVDVKGKIKNTKVVEKTLPDPVADCMLKVIKTTPFPEVDKCWDATLTIPITFPTPK